MDIKSFVVYVADNWGATDYVGIRSIEFYDSDDTLISVAASDFTFFATGSYAATYADEVFITTTSKIAGDGGNGWTNRYSTNQVICAVFNTALTDVQKMVVNNYHYYGGNTTRGAKNVQCIITSDELTSLPGYDSSINNGTTIYDGQFLQHSSINAADDQIFEFRVVSGTILDGSNNVLEDDTGTPLAVSVLLYKESTGELIASTTASTTTGEYEFNYIPDDEYYIVATPEGYQAQVFNGVRSVEME